MIDFESRLKKVVFFETLQLVINWFELKRKPPNQVELA